MTQETRFNGDDLKTLFFPSRAQTVMSNRYPMIAFVVQVCADGLSLSSRKGGTPDLWLPKEEWGETSEWGQLCDTAALNDEMLVRRVEFEPSGRNIVSRRNLSFAETTTGWLHQPQTMIVESASRSIVRGRIGKISAEVDLVSYFDLLLTASEAEWVSDHMILVKGDLITGIVTAIDADKQWVRLDVVQYIELLRSTLNPRFQYPIREKQSKVHIPSPIRLKEHLVEKLTPVLLVEDSVSTAFAISDFLTTSKFEVQHIRSIETIEDSVIAPPKMAIIDLNLDMNSLGGIEIARRLQNDITRLLLISGEPLSSRKFERCKGVKAHSFLAKPFTLADLAYAIEACATAEARDLNDILQEEVPLDFENSQEVLKEVLSSETDRDKIFHAALESLRQVRADGALHIFQLHRRSLRARLIANLGEGLNWFPYKGKVHYSRIKDAAFTSQPIYEFTNAAPHLHLWTLKMMPYEAFYGLKIPYENENEIFVLVGFFKTRVGFSDEFHWRIKMAVERIARTLERHRFVGSLLLQHNLATSGISLELVAHELYDELSAINTLVTLTLDNHPGKDSEQKEKNRTRLANISSQTAQAIRKVATLRGFRTIDKDVSLSEAVLRAVAALNRTKTEAPELFGNIRIEPPNLERVERARTRSTEAGLLIAFYNVLLNSLQQLAAMQIVMKGGTISTDWDIRCDSRGIRWAHGYFSDTGPGIHAEDWKRIFEPAYSTKEGGTGLGLTATRHLLRSTTAHGEIASISLIYSRIWDGSRFLIRIPLT